MSGTSRAQGLAAATAADDDGLQKGAGAYRCVRCASTLSVAGEGFVCDRCASVFPVLGGVPILTHRPDALLAAAQGSLDAAWSEWQRTRAALATTGAQERWSDGLTQRAMGRIEGSEKNIDLVKAYMTPVTEYLQRRTGAPATALGSMFGHTGGYDAHGVLKYFYQDYLPTPAASEAAALIREAVMRDRPDHESIAVLGAGACGTVHAVAEGFDAVYGIDLSVSTLLVAKGVLSGDTIAPHFPEAQWQPVRVTGPGRGYEGIRLMVADAAALPFDDGSLSAVVTQYLMDAVGNPLAVAAEIGRVLKPGGVWVNTSAPFTLPTEPAWVDPPTLDELPAMMRPFGFDVHTQARRHFDMLDLTALDPGIGKVSEEVYFFVARRQNDAVPSGDAAPPDVRSPDFRSVRIGAISWSAVPRIMPGRSILLVQKTVYTGQMMIKGTEIRVRHRAAPIGAEPGAIVDALLSQIDGARTVRDIFVRLTAAGFLIDAEDFLEWLACLCWQQGVLELRVPAAS